MLAVSEFLIESDENLSQVERDLVDLEGTPEQETLSSIFRAIHTIKGTCAFLGYSKLESLAHTGETLLSLVRDGELVLTSQITSTLLTMSIPFDTCWPILNNTGPMATKNTLILRQN